MYIDAKGRQKMVDLIEEFYKESKDGTEPNYKSNKIMDVLFTKYVNKIINGTIRTYKFHHYHPDIDELENEAREHVYKAILKKSWNPEKGANIFSFFTTVIARNLKNFTKKNSKKSRNLVFMDYETLSTVSDEKNLLYTPDSDYTMVFEYVFEETIRYFEDSEKQRFIRLANLFKDFFYTHTGEKFRKKDFIDYAKSDGFSPSTCNLFFETIKKNKRLQLLYKELERTNFGRL